MGAKKTIDVAGASVNTGPATVGKTYTHWQVKAADTTTPVTNPAPLTTRTVDAAGALNIADNAFYATLGKPSVFTVANATDVFTIVGHGFSNAARTAITVRNSGGALPAGLSAGTVYWVQYVSADTFTLHTAVTGGSQVLVTTDGTGTNVVVRPGEMDDTRLLNMMAEGAGLFNDTDQLYFGTDAAMTDIANIVATDFDWNAAAIW
jgi:hypothetical protein